MHALRFGSLFSGIGGFDLGFIRAGMVCAWQCEIEAFASGILVRQFDTEIIKDVRDVNPDTVSPVDLVCGGFPCQDVSTAGKRAGLAGERSGLWFEFHRVIAELKPRWVVIENVPGLLSSCGGRDFAVILRGLVECGYGVAWRILDAQYFGVPQRRRRVFIVGSLGDGCAAQVLFESDGMPGDFTQGGATWPAVAGTLAPGTRAGGVSDREIESGVFTLTAHHGRYNPHEETLVFHGKASHHQSVNPSAIAPALDASKELTVYYSRENRQDSIYGTDAPANALAASRTRVMQSYALEHGIRRLTPIECERLQGFPDGWTAGQSDSARYRQLGNAVAVPVVEWIGRRIIRSWDEPRTTAAVLGA